MTAACVLFGLAVVFLIVLRVWRHRRARAAFSAKNQICVITVEGIAFGAELVMTQYRWPAIVKIAFTANLVVFYTTPSNAFLLPRRALKSVEEGIRLSACLRRWFSGPTIEEPQPSMFVTTSSLQ